MQLNVNKIGFWLGLLVTLETAIGGGALSLTNAIPATWIPYIQAWCNLLAFIGTAILTALHTPGAFAQPPVITTITEETAKKVILVLVVLGGLLLMGSPAEAQTTLQRIGNQNDANRQVIGAPSSGLFGPLAPGDLLKKLQDVNLADFRYAKAKAKAANNVITLPCWTAWVDLLSKAQAPMVGDDGQPLPQPEPHVFSTLEDASELLQALQAGGPVQVGCAALADAAKKSVAQVIAGILGGGALGGLLPISPLLIP